MKILSVFIFFALFASCSQVKLRKISSVKEVDEGSVGEISKECYQDICVGDKVLAISPLRVIGKDFYSEAEVIGIDSYKNYTVKFLKENKIVEGVFQEDISYQEGCLMSKVCVGDTVFILDESFENAYKVDVASIGSSQRSITVYHRNNPGEIFYVSKRNVFTREEFKALAQSKNISVDNLTNSH